MDAIILCLGKQSEAPVQVTRSRASGGRYPQAYRRSGPASSAKARVCGNDHRRDCPGSTSFFKSKTGILRELLDQAGFGPDYESAVQRALSASDPIVRLRLAAPIARGIHESQSAILDLLRGAGVVAPELARLERQKEGQRYERQEGTIAILRSSGKLRSGLDYTTARDIFWTLTGRDLYRMLVRDRGWSAEKYEDWLANTLVDSLVGSQRKSASRPSVSMK